jgi:hypothetical protein
MKNFLFLLASAILLSIFLLFGKSNGIDGFNFEGKLNAVDTNIAEMGWIFLCMLLGIVFGQACRTLQVQNNLSIKSLFGAELTRSLLVSPIVFGAVYLVAKDHPDIVITSILAFENGFISNVIAEKRLKALSQQ